MSKAEFVPELAEAGKITKKQADEIFSAFVGMISTSLRNGERVALPGLGVFTVVERKARKGRNPRTGVEIKIPARKGVKFSASSVLTTDLNAPKKAPEKGTKGPPRKQRRNKSRLQGPFRKWRRPASWAHMLPSAHGESFWTFSMGTVHQRK